MRRVLTILIVMAPCCGPATARSTLGPIDSNRLICVETRDVSGARDGGAICKTGRGWEQALRAERQRVSGPGRIVFTQPVRENGRWRY